MARRYEYKYSRFHESTTSRIVTGRKLETQKQEEKNLTKKAANELKN